MQPHSSTILNKHAYEAAAANIHKIWQPIQGYVYLLSDLQGLYKIGRSINVELRTAEILGRGHSAQILHTILCDDYIDAEGIIHNYYARKRVQGEWFRLTPADIKAFKSVDYLPMLGSVDDPTTAYILKTYCRLLPFDYKKALAYVMPKFVRRRA
jgi:hypothetical protein